MREHTRRVSRRAFLGGAVTFGAVCLASPAIAFATPTAAEKQAEADAVRIQVDAMQKELQQASLDYYNALGERDAAQEAKDAAQARIDETNRRIADIQGKLGNRARSMYRNGGSSFLDVLFAATSFEDFATTWGILEHLNENDADMVKEAKELRAQVEEAKAEYARQEKLAAKKTAEALAIKEQAEATAAEMEAVLAALDAEARELLEAEQRAAAEAEAARQREEFIFPPGGTNIPSKGSVIDYAESRIGCPYVWGATGPNSFDCSGLTSWCYLQIGIWIGRTTEDQLAKAKAVGAVLPLSEAAPGDVLYQYGHVGICTAYGGKAYIHAPQPGELVKRATGGRFVCALRF